MFTQYIHSGAIHTVTVWQMITLTIPCDYTTKWHYQQPLLLILWSCCMWQRCSVYQLTTHFTATKTVHNKLNSTYTDRHFQQPSSHSPGWFFWMGHNYSLCNHSCFNIYNHSNINV